MANQVGQKHTHDYYHYDNLIWQIPAWSTGVFIASFIGMASIKNTDSIFSQIPLNPKVFLGILLVVTFLFMTVSVYALYRFRLRQTESSNYIARRILGGQRALQLVTIVNASMLLFFLLLLLLKGQPQGQPRCIAIGVFIFGAIVFRRLEIKVATEEQKRKKLLTTSTKEVKKESGLTPPV